MALLSSFRFTPNAKAGDVAAASVLPDTGGWQNNAATTINTLAGDDTISSAGSFAVLGAVAGSATPAVFGPTDAYYATPASLTAASSLYSAAIANGGNGVIDMGAGKDTLTATTFGVRSIGILNGKIGGGGATPTGERMVMGLGDDCIVGQNASTGAIANTYGIYNTGTIDLGAGNDSIQGIKVSTAATGAAIFNNGSILGGDGNDSFDALIGGWAGSGTVSGGNGADVVKGFGSGNFDGGAGAKDELILGEGVYNVKYNAVPTAINASFQLTRSGNPGVVMNVVGFEAIGSALKPLAAGVHPQAVGGLRLASFTIDAAGDFSFTTFQKATAPIV
jgi:hypothetical protein